MSGPLFLRRSFLTKVEHIVGKSSHQNNLDTVNKDSLFDHWSTVLFMIVLTASIGAGLGVFAGMKLDKPSPQITSLGETSTQSAEVKEPQADDSAIRSIFARISGCVTTAKKQIPVTFYIADTPELRQRGLQGVPGLPRNHGMLFVYDSVQPAETQFWMYQTPMNLDISYLDSSGQIQSIQQMQSCSQASNSCPKYKAGIPFKAAAEFPQGFYREKGITVGDRISVNAFGDCGNS